MEHGPGALQHPGYGENRLPGMLHIPVFARIANVAQLYYFFL